MSSQALEDPAAVASCLERWFSGHSPVPMSIAMTESDLSPLGDAVCDVAIVPRGIDAGHNALNVIEYEGALGQSGDELIVAGQAVEVIDYVAASFFEPMGPTVVRFADHRGWSAFLADADLARNAGYLPRVLCSPAVLLADAFAVSAPSAETRMTRLQVRVDGRVTRGMQGGEVSHDDLHSPSGAVLALEGIAPVREILGELERRPWAGLMLAAVQVMRLTRADPDSSRVIGLSEMASGGSDVGPLRHDSHVLMRENDEFVLADYRTRRRYRLDHRAAVAAEVCLEEGAAESDTERCARRLGVATDVALRILAEVRERVGLPQ